MTETPEKRTPAQMGKRGWQQWPAHLTVEYGPVSTEAGMYKDTIKSYRVYVDGQYIGTVTSQRERATRPISKGSRIITTTGHPVKWRERPVAGRRGRYFPSGGSDSRAEATALLIQAHLGEQAGR